MIKRHWIEKILTRKFDYIIVGDDFVSAVALIKAAEAQGKRTLWILEQQSISFNLTELIKSGEARNYIEDQLGLTKTSTSLPNQWLELQLGLIAPQNTRIRVGGAMFMDYENLFIELKGNVNDIRHIRRCVSQHVKDIHCTKHVIAMEKTLITSFSTMSEYNKFSQEDGCGFSIVSFEDGFNEVLVGGARYLLNKPTETELLNLLSSSITSIKDAVKSIYSTKRDDA